MFVPAAIKSTSSTGGIGYYTGAGAAVTQITTAATGVTINAVCGAITTVALTTAGAAEETFVVTNSAVEASDCIVFGTNYAGAGIPFVTATAVSAGAFTVQITNVSASSLNALMVINFAIIRTKSA